MLRRLARHHHFRADLEAPTDVVSRLETAMVDLLLTTTVEDVDRDSSIAFELKHQAAVMQLGRLLAEKRGLDIPIASTGALLHDIAVVVTGRYTDHARRGEPFAREMLDTVGGFDLDAVETIVRVIVNHSDKDIVSDDPYIEFGKDADILDCFLYPSAIDEYFLYKSLPVAKHYLERAKAVWTEIGLAPRREFFLLDELDDGGWMDKVATLTAAELVEVMSIAAGDPSLPPFAVRKLDNGRYEVHGTRSFKATISSTRSPDGALESDLAVFDEQWHIIWPALGGTQAMQDEWMVANLISRNEQ